MSTVSPRLNLPLISSGQAQKHITYNEAILTLDLLVQLRVKKQTNAPPDDAGLGDVFIVQAPAQGAWTGRDLHIAIMRETGWEFFVPDTGFHAFIEDERAFYLFTQDGGWEAYAAPPLFEKAKLGLNATASASERLFVKSDSIVFSHDDAGDGGLQLKLNKASVDGFASLLFQTGFVGHAEIGLTGSNDLTFKVSPDGQVFFEMLRFSASGERADLGCALRMANGAEIYNDGMDASSGLVLRGGGGLGPVSMTLINDVTFGVAGALLSQKSPIEGIDLVDIAFETLSHKMNMRVESRPEYCATGMEPEFQVFLNNAGLVEEDEYLLRASGRAVKVEKPLILHSVNVADLPPALDHAPGSLIFVTDAPGGATPAFSDGDNWRNCSDRSLISMV